MNTLNISDTDVSQKEVTNIINFKDTDLQKLNKNPLNIVDKKLHLQKKVYRKVDLTKPKVQQDFVDVKLLKSAKMPV